ncbi:MAG: DUF3810 domain-containing protein [Agriterribacter sp.]
MQRLNRRIVVLTILSLAAVAVHLYAGNAQRVEGWYTAEVYPAIASFFRTIFGYIPFSIGDLLYAAVVLLLVWRTIRLFCLWKTRKISTKAVTSRVLSLLIVLLSVYLVFNVLWGLNYNRTGIHEQMDFTREKYSKEELLTVNELLAERVNTCKSALTGSVADYPAPKALFSKTIDVYQKISKQYPSFTYNHPSIKPSMFSWLGNYFGFSGYYNPFTGEAQVNTQVPAFLQPYVCCHEIAHQLGYAKENEANFVAYIVATASGDSLFMYSAYFDLFMYANRSLRRIDSAAANTWMQQLSAPVKEDIETLRQYYRKYENPVDPLISWAYGKYLQANSQPMGLMSYDEVVADLIGYYKKYGKIGGE